MPDRIIIHCDCNSFFASVESVLQPELRSVPMAVAGDPKNRHGIILAKNELAKKYGIKTAETIREARHKCPELVCVPPHHDLYEEYCERINKIYLDYTDLVEPFSIDESFLDVTGTLHLFGMSPGALADGIRARIRSEIGITVSAGVSFCKTFAKLGSDYKKPDATTVIMRKDVPTIVYPLPVGALLFVGAKSQKILESYSIHTCGELAQYDEAFLTHILGKQGSSLWQIIHCRENEPVRSFYEKREPKSIGNSMTFSHDLTGMEEIRPGLRALSDRVASRLRHAHKKCSVIQIQIRDPSFKTLQRQRKLDVPTNLQKEIFEVSLELFRENWNDSRPVRLLGITGSDLVDDSKEEQVQLSLFDDDGKADKARQEKLEDTVDNIRRRFGNSSIGFGAKKGPGKPDSS